MKTRSSKRSKTPWPTKDAMEQIYEKNLWGGGDRDFYSGDGSHHSELTDPYIQVVRTFLRSFDSALVVCDLGCGDFNVGRQLISSAKKYVAVDIVSDLIEHNKKTFKAANLEFHCLDIATDALPPGDCAILRNVLQHLSNADIEQIVPKLSGFDHVIVTEHVPEGDFSPNADIISGQGIRLKKESGVDLTAPPFNFRVKAKERWLSLPYEEGKGLVETTLYKV